MRRLDPVHHRVDQVQRVEYVVGVVLPRVADRLTDLDVGREVHHPIEPALFDHVRDLVTVARSPSTSSP